MKKLFTVTYEAETVVYAETREEAEKIADRLARRDLEFEQTAVYETGKTIPWGWDGDSIPYGSDELTIDEIMAAEMPSDAKGEP